MSERHREALAHLLYGLTGNGGFVLLTGEIGAGKTTVFRHMMNHLPRRCNVAYIYNPRLNSEEMLKSVCEEFRIPLPTSTSGTKAYIDALNEFLLKTHAVNQTSVLIIDEAQNLSIDVLEQLRLLTNLETTKRKLLQIILIGQPELRDMLNRPELEQLSQRVVARFHLAPLSAEETYQYIVHRLSVAGWRGALPFDVAAITQLIRLSRGVPRRINLLGDRALLAAYAQAQSQVTAAMVIQASKEVFGNEDASSINHGWPSWLGRLGWMTAGVSVLLILLISAYVLGQRGGKVALNAVPNMFSSVPTHRSEA